MTKSEFCLLVLFYKQQTFISHSSGGWEIQDQGSWQIQSFVKSCFRDECLFPLPSHGGGKGRLVLWGLLKGFYPYGLPVNVQGWFPLALTGLISLLSKGLSRVFSSTTVQKHQFFDTQPFPYLKAISTLFSNGIFKAALPQLSYFLCTVWYWVILCHLCTNHEKVRRHFKIYQHIYEKVLVFPWQRNLDRNPLLYTMDFEIANRNAIWWLLPHAQANRCLFSLFIITVPEMYLLWV